jgi:dolichol-phosphate mannosyltransferase
MPLRASSGETLVFVPTYNEASAIVFLVDALLALPIRCDVLVVDDGSTDGTMALLEARAAAMRVAVIVRPGRFGVGSAHKLGWLHARRFGYSRIVTLDADLSHNPSDIPRLIAALDAGADVAIGSRFAPGGGLDYRGWRRFLSHSANKLARHLLRLPIAEYTTSLRAARLDRVPFGLIESIPNDGYSFFLTAAVRFARAGLSITEVPIWFRDRIGSTSKISRFEILYAAANLARLALQRRAQPLGAVPERSDWLCSTCGQPYRVCTTQADMICLACFTREEQASGEAYDGSPRTCEVSTRSAQ